MTYIPNKTALSSYLWRAANQYMDLPLSDFNKKLEKLKKEFNRLYNRGEYDRIEAIASGEISI